MSISSPGIGSNLDVNGIISKLMEVESQPLKALQQKEASYQAKLSAYGSVKGALATFQNAVSALNSVSTFKTLNASSSDASIVSASASSTAAAGTYGIVVTSLAQAQTLSSAAQASTTTAIGAGASTTLSFQFGSIGGGTLLNGQYTGAGFTQDAAQASGTIVIDSTNNSLQGIRDAINAGNFGVRASIVNDGSVGSPYHLMLTSTNTGVSKSMKITSSGGDASITNLLAYDPAATQNLNQTVVAQNAALSVNGQAITSTSNAVTGAIAGVTLNLAKAGTANLTFANNTAAVVSAVQAFVTAYNSANSTISGLTSYNATTKVAGLLLGDTPTQQIQSRMRSTLSGALAGLGSNTLTNLTQAGVSFLKDGTLSLNTAKLNSALASNFGDFAQLFAAIGKPSDSLVNYVSSTANTKAGSYAVNVTSVATRGNSIGSDKGTQANLAGVPDADLNIVAASNDKLLVTVDGGLSVAVTLTAGLYADAAALATQVQSDINAALGLAGQTTQVNVTQNAGKLSINSTTFGSSSAIGVSDDPGFPLNTGASSMLGLAPVASTISTISAGVNDQLTLSINGTSGTVTLAAGRYTAATLATQLQAAINGTVAFTSFGESINVSQAADVFTLTSDRYGATSAVNVTGGSAMSNLFGAAPTATAGTDVVGTINGVAATGSGQNLTGATDDASEGIRLLISGATTGARGTVDFSQGYGYKMDALLSNFLGSSGAIASSTNSTNRNIADLNKQAQRVAAHLVAVEKQYRAQFVALDLVIAKMTTTSSFLTQQLASLESLNS